MSPQKWGLGDICRPVPRQKLPLVLIQCTVQHGLGQATHAHDMRLSPGSITDFSEGRSCLSCFEAMKVTVWCCTALTNFVIYSNYTGSQANDRDGHPGYSPMEHSALFLLLTVLLHVYSTST